MDWWFDLIRVAVVVVALVRNAFGTENITGGVGGDDSVVVGI